MRVLIHRSYIQSSNQSVTCWHNDLQSPSDFTNGLTSMVFSSLRTQSAEALSTLRPQLRKRKHCDGFDRSSASKYLGKGRGRLSHSGENCWQNIAKQYPGRVNHDRAGSNLILPNEFFSGRLAYLDLTSSVLAVTQKIVNRFWLSAC